MTETPLSLRRWVLEEYERGKVKEMDNGPNKVKRWMNVDQNTARSTR
jgi:hypothetical protein